jgi:hypothetical protein
MKHLNIYQLTDKLFQEMRSTVDRLGSLWEKIRTAVELFILSFNGNIMGVYSF